jgi:competence protein ComEC
VPHLSALLTAALATGIAMGVISTPPRAFVVLLLCGAWTSSLLTYLRGYRRVQMASIAVLTTGAGWALASQSMAAAMYPPLRALFDDRLGDDPVTIEGRLRHDGVLTEAGVVLRVDVERIDVNGAFEAAVAGVSVGVGGAPRSDDVERWRAGRLIRAPVLLRRPARYLNRGLGDQERALARRGIALVGTIKSASLIEIVERGRWWEEAAAAVRARTRAALRRHVVPRAEQSSAIATAILIGDRAGLTPDLERRLQEAGTYHVIAISGGNIAILATGLLFTFGVLGVRGRVAAAMVVGALASYALIAAGGASVLRATMMASLYLGVRLIDQRTAAANAVSLTAAFVLLATPLAIVDVGFWLTFGATIALLQAGKGWKAEQEATKAERAFRLVVSVIAATAAVEIALLPVAAFVFQRVTIAGLLLNVAALPAMTLLQVAAMGVVALDAVGCDPGAALLGRAVHAGTLVLTDSTRLLDYAPWLTWRVSPPHIVVVGVYYVLLLFSLIAAARRWPRVSRAAILSGACGLFVWIAAAPAAHVRARGDGRLHLSLLDVGQGDAMLVTFPNGRTLLLDTGGVSLRGEFDVGDRVIGPAIRARELLTLDYLAITHADPDHIGGAVAVARDFGPLEVWWGVPVANHEATHALRREAEQRRSSWRTLQRGDRLEIGEVELRVHHPPPPDWERQRVRNDDSLVIEVRYGNVSMLLTGDISRAVEHDLLATLDLLPTVILKVPHHGSATSSSVEFVEHVRAAVALIGVGRGNPYGHPVRAVLDRLQDAGAQVFRTDLDGQVDVVTDGREVKVTTFTGRTFRMEERRR